MKISNAILRILFMKFEKISLIILNLLMIMFTFTVDYYTLHEIDFITYTATFMIIFLNISTIFIVYISLLFYFQTPKNQNINK